MTTTVTYNNPFEKILLNREDLVFRCVRCPYKSRYPTVIHVSFYIFHGRSFTE